MFDPTVVPDALPLTGIPWADVILKIFGALGVLLTILGNVLPKIWPVTQTIAKIGPDLRGIVPMAAAKAEAIAQIQGMTTVPQDVLPSILPLKSDKAPKP